MNMPDGIDMNARPAVPYEVAVVYSSQTFVFEPGSRMRTALCLVCNQAAGPHPVAVIGVAALDGAPCACGVIVSDVFLVHTSHMPLNRVAFQSAMTRTLSCDFDHHSN